MVTGGAEIYALNLLKALTKIDSEDYYLVYLPSDKVESFRVDKKNFKFKSKNFSSPYLRTLWEQFFLPFELWKNKIDILFTTGNIDCFFSPCKRIVVIHNSLPFSAPEMFSSRLKLHYLRNMLKLTSKTADKIITVSETARGEIIKYLNISPGRIKPIYHGFTVPDTIKDENSIKERFGIRGKYILSISSVYRFKNYINLIRAFDIYRKRSKSNYRMVIIGEAIEEDYYNQMIVEIEKLNLKDYVVFINGLPHNELFSIYKAASLYVFPSYCESFGLTLVEAMAFGIPVITSNTSVMPEICQDAAIYFDPNNPNDIADKMLMVVQDRSLQQKLREKGLKRAQEFSWQKTAEETLEVFNEVYRVAKQRYK